MSSTEQLFFPQTTFPVEASNDIFPQTTMPTDVPNPQTIDVHSDRTSDGVFSIETQTSVQSTTTNDPIFSIQTQTSALSTTSTFFNGGNSTVPAGTIGVPSPTSSNPTSTTGLNDAGQIGASFGLLGFVMLAWMGLFSFQR